MPDANNNNIPDWMEEAWGSAKQWIGTQADKLVDFAENAPGGSPEENFKWLNDNIFQGFLKNIRDATYGDPNEQGSIPQPGKGPGMASLKAPGIPDKSGRKPGRPVPPQQMKPPVYPGGSQGLEGPPKPPGYSYPSMARRSVYPTQIPWRPPPAGAPPAGAPPSYPGSTPSAPSYPGNSGSAPRGPGNNRGKGKKKK